MKVKILSSNQMQQNPITHIGEELPFQFPGYKFGKMIEDFSPEIILLQECIAVDSVFKIGKEFVSIFEFDFNERIELYQKHKINRIHVDDAFPKSDYFNSNYYKFFSRAISDPKIGRKSDYGNVILVNRKIVKKISKITCLNANCLDNISGSILGIELKLLSGKILKIINIYSNPKNIENAQLEKFKTEYFQLLQDQKIDCKIEKSCLELMSNSRAMKMHEIFIDFFLAIPDFFDVNDNLIIGGDFNSSSFGFCVNNDKSWINYFSKLYEKNIFDSLREYNLLPQPTFVSTYGSLAHQSDYLLLSKNLCDGILHCETAEKKDVFIQYESGKWVKDSSDHLPIKLELNLEKKNVAQPFTSSFKAYLLIELYVYLFHSENYFLTEKTKSKLMLAKKKHLSRINASGRYSIDTSSKSNVYNRERILNELFILFNKAEISEIIYKKLKTILDS